jgi:hypothetical protein
MGIAGEYSKSILKHWKVVVLSLSALVAIVNNWNKFQQWLHLPWWAWLAIILASLNIAQFLAWKDMRQRWIDLLESQLEFSKALRADRAEILATFRQSVEDLKAINSKPKSTSTT